MGVIGKGEPKIRGTMEEEGLPPVPVVMDILIDSGLVVVGSDFIG